MVRRVEQSHGVTEDVSGEGSGGLAGEDDQVDEGGGEGDEPDERDKGVRSLHRANVDVTDRSAHGDVALHGHAGQVQRAVPAGRHTDRSDSS